MPVAAAPLAWNVRFSATLPPGDPEPEDNASEAVCADASVRTASEAQINKILIQNLRCTANTNIGCVIAVAVVIT